VAGHLVPNQVLGFFEFFREREKGELFVFKGLQKPLSAQIHGNLNLRRLPPTVKALRLNRFVGFSDLQTVLATTNSFLPLASLVIFRRF